MADSHLGRAVFERRPRRRRLVTSRIDDEIVFWIDVAANFIYPVFIIVRQIVGFRT